MNRIINRIVPLLMSLAFAVAGIFIIYQGVNRLGKLNAGRYTETQATITRIDTRTESDSDGFEKTVYDLTVEYSLDGRKVVAQLRENPRDFYEGMELAVLYDVEDPTAVILPGTANAFIMIGVGAFAVLAGAVLFIKPRRGG